MVIFATATVLAFVLLRDSRFNFHCYTQREATPLLRNRPGSAALRPLATDSVLTRKITKRIHSSKPAESPNTVSASSLTMEVEAVTH